MAVSTKLRLRNLWFSVHKWLGLGLAILIVPVSLTGSALVWHDWLDAQINPQRHAAGGPAALAPSVYAASAKRALSPGERLSSLAFPEEGPVVATATKPAVGGGRPERIQVWLDPNDGRVFDKAGGNEGVVRFLHMLHGTLMVPGWGRPLVGWIGVAMLLSSLTGLWLWWPVTGSVRRGFRWRRQPAVSANLHHMGGFWIALPLAMLSFTGMWISFPAFFGPLSGAPAQARPAPSQPLKSPRLGPDSALVAGRSQSGGRLASIGWPDEKGRQWTVAFAGRGGNAEVKVDDSTGRANPPPPRRPEPLARAMRRWHDGTGMGPVWQTLIFLGGILPALLAVTGILMWLRTRRYRARPARG